MRISQKSNGHQSSPDSNRRAEPVSHENPLFVYIRIPGDIDPEDRWEKFADPLQQALEKEDLGDVTGGGTQFSEPDENGEDFVEFCGIDVDLYDAVKGLALLRRELILLQVPPGTALLYKLGGQDWEEPVYRMDS
ncbi:MAG TPA: hypothetical protein VHW72_12475 [Candidatus Angelobacter sp.]|jgi:hypothetical protein|nr:hypothetical protein [Candidatus Angelobacter sp.]